MNRLTGTVLLIGLLPLSAVAQNSEYSKWDGYFYAAPGLRAGSTSLLSLQFKSAEEEKDSSLGISAWEVTLAG